MRTYHCGKEFSHKIYGLQNCGYYYGGSIGRLQCNTCRSLSEAFTEGKKEGISEAIRSYFKD